MVSKVTLGAGLVLLFIGILMILTRVIPGPHGRTDYLVMGTFATLFCLAILVGVYFSTRRGTDLFYKRRK